MKTALRIVTSIVSSLLLATALNGPAQAAPEPSMVRADSLFFDHDRDFNGDGNADVLARDSHGVLWLYPGNGYGGFLARRKISGGWNNMSAIITGYFTSDRHNDIIARDRHGNLWLYAGTGHATFKHPVRIGTGWNAFTVIQNLSLTPRYSAILVRDRSGVLWAYAFNTSSLRFYPHPKRLGGGWNQYAQILAVGDWSGDSNYGDVIAIDRSGRFWVYAQDPYGTFYPRKELIGTGPRYTALIAPSDWDGYDGSPDLMGRDRHGDLWVFSPALKPHRVGHGFNGYTLF